MQYTDTDSGERTRSAQRRCAAKRTVFTRHQLEQMEERFSWQTFLSKEERKEFAGELCLGERQVMIWFQNRRGRLKRRGPSDKAYTAKKLDELTNRRPYPYIPCQLTTLRTSPVKPQTPTRDATWPTYGAPPNASHCSPVAPRQDAVHPNGTKLTDVTSAPVLRNYIDKRAQLWLPSIVAENQQQTQAYGIQPYYNATSWSCNVLRPNSARFDSRQNLTFGRSSTEQSQNMTLPVCSIGNATNLTAVGCCNDTRQQATEMTYFGSEPALAETHSGYSEDFVGVNPSGCVQVW